MCHVVIHELGMRGTTRARHPGSHPQPTGSLEIPPAFRREVGAPAPERESFPRRPRPRRRAGPPTWAETASAPRPRPTPRCRSLWPRLRSTAIASKCRRINLLGRYGPAGRSELSKLARTLRWASRGWPPGRSSRNGRTYRFRSFSACRDGVVSDGRDGGGGSRRAMAIPIGLTVNSFTSVFSRTAARSGLHRPRVERPRHHRIGQPLHRQRPFELAGRGGRAVREVAVREPLRRCQLHRGTFGEPLDRRGSGMARLRDPGGDPGR